MRMRENSMLVLYLISGIIAYAHKIPFLGKIIALISFYYGKTTWWKILVKIRKAFIIFNALIGIYVVIKTTGFGVDTFYANFIALGENYLNIFYNFTKRIFNWIFDLFDHKIVPNVPNEPKNPKSFTGWNNSNTSSIIDIGTNNELPKKYFWVDEWLKQPKINNTDWFTSPNINVNIDSNPWYKDLSTWLIIGGVISLLGISYLGYSYIFNSNTAISPTSDSTITPNNSLFTTFSSNISNSIKSLNSYNWFLSTTDTEVAHNTFVNTQRSVDFDKRFYPFTQADPFKPWYTRLRILVFGENASEIDQRIHDKDIAWRYILPTNFTNNTTSGTITPSIGIVGLLNNDKSLNLISYLINLPLTSNT